MMRLTPFANAALLILAGMIVSLFAGKAGWVAYGLVVGALTACVLIDRWRAGVRPDYSHEERDE